MAIITHVRVVNLRKAFGQKSQGYFVPINYQLIRFVSIPYQLFIFDGLTPRSQ